MKIVQSFWSKPASSQGGLEAYTGNWPRPRAFWHAWVLSTCWAHKHYGRVELVTDNQGAAWLVDKLKLPFAAVRTDLEQPAVPTGLWAYGKLVAYSLQQEPFFHIDGDVFLSARLPAEYEQAQLLCQYFETGAEYPHFDVVYDFNRAAIERDIPILPSFWRFMADRSAANCGIVGGNNVTAIHKYCADVGAMLTEPRNQAGWRKLRPNRFITCL